LPNRALLTEGTEKEILRMINKIPDVNIRETILEETSEAKEPQAQDNTVKNRFNRFRMKTKVGLSGVEPLTSRLSGLLIYLSRRCYLFFTSTKNR
jgi:hypothetical protein